MKIYFKVLDWFELNKLHYKINIGSIKMTHFKTVIKMKSNENQIKWRQNFTTVVKKVYLLPFT